METPPPITDAALDALLALEALRHAPQPACCVSPEYAICWGAAWYGACAACPLYARGNTEERKCDGPQTLQ
jgi:hypothetical protein